MAARGERGGGMGKIGEREQRYIKLWNEYVTEIKGTAQRI